MLLENCTGDCPCKKITICKACKRQLCHFCDQKGLWREGYYSHINVCIPCANEIKNDSSFYIK